jgi:hypothetical protein
MKAKLKAILTAAKARLVLEWTANRWRVIAVAEGLIIAGLLKVIL